MEMESTLSYFSKSSMNTLQLSDALTNGFKYWLKLVKRHLRLEIYNNDNDNIVV